jgi:hypothetical protein
MRSLVALAVLVAAFPLAAGAAAPAPKIAGTTLDGKRLSLADLRGRPVIVNIWSSW